MPPAKGEKKGLTLEKLATYDDVITDALVDKVGRKHCASATTWSLSVLEHLR
jgi:hypothetical protein